MADREQPVGGTAEPKPVRRIVVWRPINVWTVVPIILSLLAVTVSLSDNQLTRAQMQTRFSVGIDYGGGGFDSRDGGLFHSLAVLTVANDSSVVDQLVGYSLTLKVGRDQADVQTSSAYLSLVEAPTTEIEGIQRLRTVIAASHEMDFLDQDARSPGGGEHPIEGEVLFPISIRERAKTEVLLLTNFSYDETTLRLVSSNDLDWSQPSSLMDTQRTYFPLELSVTLRFASGRITTAPAPVNWYIGRTNSL